MGHEKMNEALYSAEEVRRQFADVKRRAEEADRTQPRAVSARYDTATARIVVVLTTGVEMAFPLALLQGLAGASPKDLAHVEVSPQGTGLHWKMLDADFSVAGLIAGVFGTQAWMKELGRKGGSTTSTAKAAAARTNGKKGGRPPLVRTMPSGNRQKGASSKPYERRIHGKR